MKGKEKEIVSEIKTAVFSKPVFTNKKIQNNNLVIRSEPASSVVPVNNDKIELVSGQFQDADYLNLSGQKEIAFEDLDSKQEAPGHTFKENLIRLFLKKGEYIYARPDDIVMVESCDHLVKVYIVFDDKIKKTIRCNTLKDFLLQLPQNHFIRIGRFCAINLKRLSGGDYNQQTFEFDFKISIKLKHPISCSCFNNIGK